MTHTTLRDATAADFDAIVALNAAAVDHTSPMDLARLRELDALAHHHRVAVVDGRVAAFLLAMPHGAAYANANFEWFAARWPAFAYVDRIVVGDDFHGRGLGPLLYDDLFECCRAAGLPRVACEYNIDPPNEPSRRFHDRLGFHEVGRQWLGDGAKQVSMQLRVLEGAGDAPAADV